MNKTKKIITGALLLSATSLLANNGAQNRCIIEFNDGTPTNKISEIAKDLAQKGNSSIAHTYKNVMKGATLNMPCFAAEAAFGRDVNIKSFKIDAQTYAIGKPSKNPTPVVEEPIATQEISWGTQTVGSFDGTGKTAWIIDTGIDLDHKDLNVDSSKAFTTYGTRKKGSVIPYYNDDNGHGTHVAGIIGAKNNTEGTLGVAQGATVVPVKVLNSAGSGYVSDLIAGIDYVAGKAQTGDCVNISIGTPADDDLDNAVIKAAFLTGAYFTIAAGNETQDTVNVSPARANGINVFTVAAIDENNTIAWFSNYGSSVDFAAPGVDILSTYNDGKTTSMSGTSMAAPHVCGALMSGNVTSIQTAYNDPDGIADPIIKIVQ